MAKDTKPEVAPAASSSNPFMSLTDDIRGKSLLADPTLIPVLLTNTAISHDRNGDHRTTAAESAASIAGRDAGAVLIMRIREVAGITNISHPMMEYTPSEQGISLELAPNIRDVKRDILVNDAEIMPATRIDISPSPIKLASAPAQDALFQQVDAVRLSDICRAHPVLNCEPAPNGKVLIRNTPGREL